MGRGWIPREGRLWIAVLAITLAACWGGAKWGASGGAWTLGARAQVKADPSRPNAWETTPSGDLRTILGNNCTVYASLTLGLATAGVWTLVTYAFGVATIGFSIGVAQKEHVPARLVFAMLAPHGVLEVLSFALVAVVGLRALWVGWEYARSGALLMKKGETAVWMVRIGAGFVLMLAAAFIEAYVTPKVIQSEVERLLSVQAPR